MKAIWKNTIIAESDDTQEVEGNAYFPPESLHMKFFEKTTHTTHCPWKGEASYYTIVVDGERNENAAWTYEDPKPEAKNIKEHIAFWKGVEVKQ